MHTLLIPCEPGDVSDGYQSFNDLYAHRNALLIALMNQMPDVSWVSGLDEDGKGQDRWFNAGLLTTEGQVGYELPYDLWQIVLCTGCKVLDRAPHCDGTPEQMVGRLLRSVIGTIRKTPDTDSVGSGVDSPS